MAGYNILWDSSCSSMVRSLLNHLDLVNSQLSSSGPVFEANLLTPTHLGLKFPPLNPVPPLSAPVADPLAARLQLYGSHGSAMRAVSSSSPRGYAFYLTRFSIITAVHLNTSASSVLQHRHVNPQTSRSWTPSSSATHIMTICHARVSRTLLLLIRRRISS